MGEKKAGQALVAKLVAWVQSFCYFDDPTTALVVVLWTLGTWAHEHFYSFPFLAITAAVKGAGKTRVLEVIKLLARQGAELGASVELTAGPTPAAILALIRDYEGRFTLLWDEADAASSEKKGFLSEVVNTAYRKGGTIPRRSGEKVILWKSYCSIAFALIGDLNNTFRDRSVVVSMTRGPVGRDFESEMAIGVPIAEGEALRADIFRFFAGQPGFPRASVPAHLTGRDREIWAALFGLVEFFGLSDAARDALVRWSSDNAGAKTAEKRSATSYESELDATIALYAERALRDLARVLPVVSAEHSGDIHSAEAVARMKGLADGPWRTFRGARGLTEEMLAGMVKRFGVRPSPVRMARGRAAKQLSGYRRGDVLASVPNQKVKGGGE